MESKAQEPAPGYGQNPDRKRGGVGLLEDEQLRLDPLEATRVSQVRFCPALDFL